MRPPRLFLAQAGKQEGVVLLITLIMLVAMTLGGIALIRSVHTTTLNCWQYGVSAVRYTIGQYRLRTSN